MPTIRFPTDTSNFDCEDPRFNSTDSSQREATLENGKYPQHAFFEFTFKRFFDEGAPFRDMKVTGETVGDDSSPVYV